MKLVKVWLSEGDRYVYLNPDHIRSIVIEDDYSCTVSFINEPTTAPGHYFPVNADDLAENLNDPEPS